MATIYKRSGYETYYCAFSGADGKRKYRNTGNKTKRDAKRQAQDWEDAENKLKGSATETQKEISDIIGKIARLANSGELTEAKSRRALVDIHRLATGDTLRLFTTEEWLENWKAQHPKTESDATTQSRNRSIKHILEALGEKKGQRIDLISAQDLQEVKAWFEKQKTRSAQPVRKSTQNIKLGHLRAAFEAAHNQGIILSNPAKAITNFPASDSQIVGDFTEIELQRLINAAEGQWRNLIILAALTGLRRENLLRLKWNEVALAERCLHVRLVKQRDGRKPKVAMIPLSPEAYEAISELQGLHSTFVFSELCKLKGSDPNNRFGRIMLKAEVSREIEQKGGIKVKRSFHSLRHTFTSLLANAHVDAEIRQKLTGHSDAAIHSIYTHLDQKTLVGAIETLPKLLSA